MTSSAVQMQPDGNPDDEYYSDWYRWFSGDPNANVDSPIARNAVR